MAGAITGALAANILWLLSFCIPGITGIINGALMGAAVGMIIGVGTGLIATR